MSTVDRRVGAGLTLLSALVLYSARSFPDVPGQKLGAGFLPMLVGAGLLLCGLALMLRRPRGADPAARHASQVTEQVGPALVVVAAVLLYVLAAPRLGFLLVAPLLLLMVCRGLRESWAASIGWAVGGTLVVHLVFYKLLRVPLPWGLLRPFY